MSAVGLLVCTTCFGLTSAGSGMQRYRCEVWSMRMIGLTVFALAGNMWNNAAQSSDARIGNVAKVMVER